MYQTTRNILEKTEAHLLGLPADNRYLSIFTRYLVFPFNFLIFGFFRFSVPFMMWSTLSILFLTLGLFAFNEEGGNFETKVIFFYFLTGLSFLISMFSVPSTYSFYGIKENIISDISDIIKSNGVDSIDKVNLLEINMKIVWGRISSRITFYRWCSGALWAAYVLIFNIGIGTIVDVNFESRQKIVNDSIESFAVTLSSLFIIFVLIMAYKRASEILIKSIEFSCVEIKSEILNK